MIKISIIIPCYNCENTIIRCLDSIVNQTLKEIEIIVIDDGSTDLTLKKIEKYEGIKVFSQKNSGVSVARNKGIDLVTGEYIFFVDSDDYLENENVLKNIYEYGIENKLDIVMFDYFLEKENRKKYILTSNEKQIDNLKYIKSLVNKEQLGVVWNKIIKNEYLKSLNIKFNESIKMGEDFIFNLQLLYFTNKIGRFNKACYTYVEHSKQTTKTLKKEKIYNDYLSGYNYLLKYFNNYRENEAIIKILENGRIETIYQILNKKNKNLEIYKKIKKEIKNEKKKYSDNWKLRKK